MKSNYRIDNLSEHLATQPSGKIEHALIVVSPFNGYFIVKNMEILFRWAKDYSTYFNIFFMDKASKYNLIATGYNEEEAIRRTRKQDQNLYNKIITCLKTIGFNDDEAKEKILLISQLYQNESYLKIYEKCIKLFETDFDFRNNCLNISKSFLEGKMTEISEDSTNIAVNYLLEELPIWFDTPSIINVPSSVLVYKDFSDFWQNVCCNYNLASNKQKIYVKNVNNTVYGE